MLICIYDADFKQLWWFELVMIYISDDNMD